MTFGDTTYYTYEFSMTVLDPSGTTTTYSHGSNGGVLALTAAGSYTIQLIDSYSDGGGQVTAAYTYVSGTTVPSITTAGTSVDSDDDNDGILDTCTNLDYNNDGLNDFTGTNTAPYEIPGGDGNSDGIIDCEIDYDRDLDDDRWRAIDQNYNGKWDWFDSDMGGTSNPDNPLGDSSWNLSLIHI